jgi:hypothetical protein
MENPQRLHVQSRSNRLNANWVVGFVDGEGCFYVGINPRPEMSSQYQVLPEFTVVQHRRDIRLLFALKNFFQCGVVRTNHDERMVYRVRRFEHLRDLIIPFFEKHPLKSQKQLDFLKFRDVLHRMEAEQHLTVEGIEAIRGIAKAMNRGRER